MITSQKITTVHSLHRHFGIKHYTESGSAIEEPKGYRATTP